MNEESEMIEQQMDKTMAGLTDKLGKLEDRVSGTVNSVRDSVVSVRDTFDLKLQVRRRPWTLLAGAVALGLVCGLRSHRRDHWRPRENGHHGGAARTAEPAFRHQFAGANAAVAHEAGAARISDISAPSWVAKLSAQFEPEIAELRGIAIGSLLGIAHGVIAKNMPRPKAPPE